MNTLCSEHLSVQPLWKHWNIWWMSRRGFEFPFNRLTHLVPSQCLIENSIMAREHSEWLLKNKCRPHRVLKILLKWKGFGNANCPEYQGRGSFFDTEWRVELFHCCSAPPIWHLMWGEMTSKTTICCRSSLERQTVRERQRKRAGERADGDRARGTYTEVISARPVSPPLQSRRTQRW